MQSSSLVMYKGDPDGPTGCSICITWSWESNLGGGVRRLSLTGSKSGVLGSDGSCEDDFKGLVCSDPPSDPVGGKLSKVSE